jgi:hypothetical protein
MRAHERGVLVGGVVLEPLDAVPRDGIEAIARLELPDRQVERPLRRERLDVRRDGRVHGLDIVAERAGERLWQVPEQRDRATAPERACGARGAVLGADPVPRLRGEDERERIRFERPRLERRLQHVRVDVPQLFGHARTRLQCGDVETACCEATRRLAGTRADFERAVADSERAEAHHPVEELVGVPRPRPVVLLGDFAEHCALLARHGLGFTRSNMRAVQPAISTGGSSSVAI